VRAFLARVPAALKVEQALLYGSRARGDHTSDSDADIALIVPSGTDDWRTLWILSDLAYDVFVETGILIQPVPISSQSWIDPERFGRPSFLRNVKREGVPL
jgi:predicted nucleotidyltransferase